jgi:eukaryotic-like serine/threonine-protein kinase
MSPTDPRDSHRLIGGRYRLDRSIGQGGMGTVWQGHDELLGREVAVKEVRFPPELGSQEVADLRERTLREARATARLSHPNVITTYDVVEEDDRPWIVMELLATRSLSEVLRDDGPLPPHRVAEIGLGVLAALELSHAQGVVHRDVKPGNVLITPDGRPVLTDFGIATTAGDAALTSTGLVLGSPAYMSPERARGQRPGPESDLWSLGATLYSAVDGRPPFDSPNALGTLTAVISDPVEPPDVEGPLREVILGLLAKDPADRLDIPTARGLLQRAAGDRTAEVTPVAPASTVVLDRASRTEALPLDVAPARVTPPASTYADEQQPSRGLVPVAVVLLLSLFAVAVIAYIAKTHGDGNNGATPSGTDKPATHASKTSKKPEPTKSTKRSTSTTPDASSGFTSYTDPTGFSLDVPQGWQRSQSGTQVKFSEPGTTRYLLVDQTDHPKKDPAKDWEQQEKSVSKRLPNYQRISIETVDYRDYPAADWQFTYATQTQVIDRGFVAGNKGYALYIQGPQGNFTDSQQVFQRATDSFSPADGKAAKGPAAGPAAVNPPQPRSISHG